MGYQHILVSAEEKIGILRMNRPNVLNALNQVSMEEIVHALEAFDADDSISCIVLTGSEKAWAAGADITEMADATAIEMLYRDQFAQWERIKRIHKPIIGAVSGYALGGGCELAMLCDILIASETAKFGQPEIRVGVIPGAGGTQRLTRIVGKSRAMEMVLTGEMMSADEAYQRGLVSKVVPVEVVVDEAVALARRIASQPPLAVRLAKESVLKAYETSLSEGLEFERKNFYLLFASEDQKEGMQAFKEKRDPRWQGK
ncbi:MAG: enoyl-CoA hydratase [Chlorobi bacterium]|nr:enoyl-CoA hydratase [Chlorobiota bacterium]